MLIRDPLQAGPLAVAKSAYELCNRERTHIVFLIGQHPVNNPACQSQLLVAAAVEEAEDGRSVRWLTHALHPGAVGTYLVTRTEDPALLTAHLQNRIARTCLQAEKEGFETTAWAFFQPHIRTQADADKLARYLAGYQDLLADVAKA